jgi:hypothetical protein
MTPEFTESEFRAWLERRGVTAGAVSPWEELPPIDAVRARVPISETFTSPGECRLPKITAPLVRSRRPEWGKVGTFLECEMTRQPMPTWMLLLLVAGIIIAVVWDVALDIGRMLFFWGVTR